jgi:transposase-like protein
MTTKKDYGSMTIDELAREAGSLEEVSSILKGVIGPVMEKMLQAEMDEHLGYTKHSKE